MGKLLILLACVLGTAVAGRIPISDDRMSWRTVLQEQNSRPTLMDLIGLRWQIIPRSGLVRVGPMQTRIDQDEELESELEQRYNRVPLSRDVNVESVVQSLPTSDVNNGRLLHVGRRRQQQQQLEQLENRRQGRYEDNQLEQQQQEQEDRTMRFNRRRLDQDEEQMMPRRVSRIGEGRRMDNMPVEQIMQLIRGDNRLSELSDQEIVEMLRRQRQRQQRMEGRRMNGDGGDDDNDDDENLQSLRRDDERLVHVNRRRMQQGVDEMTPLRVGRIGEGRRVEQREQQRNEGRRGNQQMEQEREESRRGNQQMEQEREEGRREMRQQEQRDEVMRREQDNQERRMRQEQNNEQRRDQDNSVDNLESVRRDDERLVHINRRRLVQDEMTPRIVGRIGRIGEGRRVGDVNAMTEQDILQFIRRDNRLTNLSDDEIIEMLRRNRQRKDQTRQEQRVEDVDQNEDIERLQSLRRDDERLVHVNRRRLEQTSQDEMMTMPRMGRMGRIGEGRRVGEQDILQFIRSDNRLTGASDEQIIEMLRRQRERRLQKVGERVEEVQGNDDSLESVRRDDERLVHINRRRLGQTV